MHLLDVVAGSVTVTLTHTQIRTLLTCVRCASQEQDCDTLQLALEGLLVLTLVSDDIRTQAAVAIALESSRE